MIQTGNKRMDFAPAEQSDQQRAHAAPQQHITQTHRLDALPEPTQNTHMPKNSAPTSAPSREAAATAHRT